MTNGYGHPKAAPADPERMAQRDMFATAALIAITPLMMPLNGKVSPAAVAIASEAYALAEAMMEVRKGRPLP